MKRIHQVIFINAPREKVWDLMLGEASYREWTAVFCPGSYYRGSWEAGSKILFLGPAFEGRAEGGMVSRIKENRLHEYISIEHQGIVKDGVEDTSSEATREWSGAQENYAFADKDGGTELTIDCDSSDKEAESMEGMWIKALAKLKEMAESR